MAECGAAFECRSRNYRFYFWLIFGEVYALATKVENKNI